MDLTQTSRTEDNVGLQVLLGKLWTKTRLSHYTASRSATRVVTTNSQ